MCGEPIAIQRRKLVSNHNQWSQYNSGGIGALPLAWHPAPAQRHQRKQDLQISSVPRIRHEQHHMDPAGYQVERSLTEVIVLCMLSNEKVSANVVYYDRSRGIIEEIDSDPCEAFRVVRRSSACGRCSSNGGG